MTRPSTPPILRELRRTSHPASQVKALRDLKNELIGHEQKKELWVELGVLTLLVRILDSHKVNGKKKHRESRGSEARSNSRSVGTEEEEARLQAIIVVGSLAYGGPAFIPPIYAALIVSPLLSLLAPTESHPQILLQALRTLNTIADSVCLSRPEQEEIEVGLSGLLYTPQHLANIVALLLQPSILPTVQQQIILTASLISKTCRKEHHRVIAAQAGILEALAVSAAPSIIDIFQGPRHVGRFASQRPHINSRLLLAPIFHAVKVVIQGSRPRGVQFLAAPALNSALSKSEADAEGQAEGSIWNASGVRPSHACRSSSKALELLVPYVPTLHSRNVSTPQSAYPPLGSISTSCRQSQGSRSLSTAIEVIQSQGLEYVGEDESPLITLLLHVFRTCDEPTSLMAAGLLLTLHRLGLTKRPRDSVLALLLVPSLVRMLDKDARSSRETPRLYQSSVLMSTDKIVKEEAPEILATLTNSCTETQDAAVDAGAIKKLSQLLKESFDPLPVGSSAFLWAPEDSPAERLKAHDDASKLGPIGISPSTHHVFKLRESVLTALAAIASEKDEYRKAVIDNGVVPFVIKTLRAEPIDVAPSFTSETSDGQPASIWNYRDSVLAACGAARALSRSVSTLRTSLMDAGLPAPLFALLQWQDIEIQIAATGVICNLVLKFSPMREVILEGGILKTLCDQAHSMNAKLRLNAMWALKNVVAGATNDVKVTCLEELGPGWLKQIVTNDAETANPIITTRLGEREDGSATPIRMNTPNAAGEQVDLLNAVEEDSRESSQDRGEDGEEDLKMSDSIGTLGTKSDRERKQSLLASQPNWEDFYGLSTGDLGSYRHSRRVLSDEVAIQKEGLEFIRNLICGEQSPEMIDHVFRELGQDKVFDLLATKLRPKVLNAFTRDRRSSETGIRHIQPHTEIVTSTCYTIVHIAAGQPRHRQMLVSQTELLKLMMPLFNHTCREIRSCVCWLVINLTWVEDNSDKQNAKARARELSRLGYMEKLEGMEKDESLDCRETGKNARDQMRNLLHV